MNINGVGPQNPHANQILKNQNANTAVEDDEQDDLNAIPAAITTEEETDNGSGVINNLLNDHFKSVPAMRLYLNHYKKIAAANSDQTNPIVEEGIDNIQGIAVVVQGFLDDQQPPPDDQSDDPSLTITAQADESPNIVGQFNEAVEQAGQNFINSTNPQIGSLVEDLKSAFDALVLALTPPEPVVETETSTGPPPDPLLVQDDTQTPSPTEQFISELTVSFEQFLQDLQESLAGANTIELPSTNSFTPPSNNGSAYDKFLSEYSQLPGVPGSGS